MMGLNNPGRKSSNLTPQYRTVLFGDSMTSQHFVDTANTSSYDPATGLLTITHSAHALPSGWYADVFNRSYAALRGHQRLPVTVIDANTYTVQLAPNLSGLPNGALVSTTMCRIPTRIAANGWFTWLQIASGYRFNLIYNGAQSGDTTADNLNRLQRHCLNYQPDVVFMQLAGINDCSSGSQQTNEETIWANQQAVMSQILAAGARLVVLTVTPTAAGEARSTLQNMQRVARMRKRLFSFAAQNPGLIVFDSYRRVVNPADATGLALTNKLKTVDNIHYSILGAREIGEAIWTQIGPLFPSRTDPLPIATIDSYSASTITLTSVSRSNNIVTATSTAHTYLTGELAKVTGGTEALNEWVTVTAVDANTISFPSVGANGSITGTILLGRNNNLFPNPLLTTASGGTVSAPATGTAAGNLRCRVYGSIATATASVVADPNGFGNRQRFVVTPAAADDRAAIEMTATGLLNGVVKAGRTYYLEAWTKLKDVVGTNLSEIQFRLMVNVDGVLHSVFALNSYDSAPINSDFEGMLRTAKMVIPPGTISQFYFEFAPRFSAAGTPLTIEIGRINIVEVDGE